MNRLDPRYTKAFNWLRRAINHEPDLTFIAVIGDYRLSCYREGPKTRWHSWYGKKDG